MTYKHFDRFSSDFINGLALLSICLGFVYFGAGLLVCYWAKIKVALLVAQNFIFG